MMNTLLLFVTMQAMMIFYFEPDCAISQWKIVNDDVMGGRSSGRISLNHKGNAVFEGQILLDNRGGFCMVKYDTRVTIPANARGIRLKIFSDGKNYQLRIKGDKTENHSYVHTFPTKPERWQTIDVPFSVLRASFRGRKLDLPAFSSEKIDELGILIGNKQKETFRFEIDWIAFY